MLGTLDFRLEKGSNTEMSPEIRGGVCNFLKNHEKTFFFKKYYFSTTANYLILYVLKFEGLSISFKQRKNFHKSDRGILKFEQIMKGSHLEAVKEAGNLVVFRFFGHL